MAIVIELVYEKDHKQPLLVLLNERVPRRWLTPMLPQELCRMIGFLCKRFNTEPRSENAAYTMGFVMEDFCEKLTEYMKTMPVGTRRPRNLNTPSSPTSPKTYPPGSRSSSGLPARR